MFLDDGLVKFAALDFGWRSASALAVTQLYWIRLYSLLKNSSFVSGHRFSDAVSSLNSNAPLEAVHSKRSFSTNCFAAKVRAMRHRENSCGDCGAERNFTAMELSSPRRCPMFQDTRVPVFLSDSV
jgi:hypothetical protein